MNKNGIKAYLDEGIDVVLGTDGHGMYSTFGGQEVILALAAGVEVADLEKIKALSRLTGSESSSVAYYNHDSTFIGIGINNGKKYLLR